MTALDDAATDLRQKIAALRRELDERTAERDEALAREAAIAEVLQVINSSAGDLAPVFDAILEKALRLCEAAHGHIWRVEGQHAHAVALHGDARFVEAMRQNGPQDLVSDRPLGRLARGEQIVHMPDATKEEVYRTNPAFREFIDQSEIRTGLVVALHKDESLLGAIVVHRKEVLPFTDKQIALLQNFAAQAVIAMENARLITETRQALEQQTATAEVLGVINSSPGDLAPVFDAILEKAHRLCGAAHGSLGIFEGETWRAVVQRGYGEPLASRLRQPNRVSDNPLLQSLLDGAPLVHLADLAQIDLPIARANVEAGIRTLLVVALRKDDALLGTISTARREVRPFSDKEIALLQNFAAQAVIAMENARLINETREALEQQTATSEVLQVINSSPGDLAPVFDAILEKAHSLCDIAQGSLELYDGEWFRAVAVRGLSDEFAETLRQGCPAADNPATQPLIEGRRFAHILDLAETDYTVTRSAAELDAARTLLCVPLRRDGALLGMIASARREVRAFSDKEIALLENFAAQAVIAMENARLINETREALEQQTATAEVLGVINSSPGDLGPVFEAILDKAHTLCGATLGSLFLFDGELFRAAATQGYPEDLAQRLRRGVVLTTTPQLLDGNVPWVHNPDLTLLDNPTARAVSGRGGVRTNLMLPLRKDGRLLGAISCNRQEVRPFSDNEIALLQNFAAQAVIAIENARLLTETREALEQQTATAEVLQVINSSPGDLAPVFDAMLEKATRLCDAPFGALRTFDGEFFNLEAIHADPEWVEQVRRAGAPGRGGFFEPLARGERVVNIADLRESALYQVSAAMRDRTRLGKIRSYLAVALHKEDILVGCLIVYRQEVRPFGDKEVALLQSFAAQAVIAMENARLLTETREALAQQTATAEVLQVINSSPGDLAPVFDAILDKAQRVCSVDHAALELYDGERMHAVAVHGASDKFAETLRQGYRASDSPAARALLDGQRFAQIPDAAQIDQIAFRTAAEVDGVRTVLFVPLRRDDAFLGMIASARREVRLFSEKEIALLENFAAQAVIAMENARLLRELRERTSDLEEALEYQTATSDVLKVISRSTFDLQPMLETVAEAAARLCDAGYSAIFRREGEVYRVATVFAFSPDTMEAAHKLQAFLEDHPLVPGRGSITGRVALEGTVVQVADTASDPEYTLSQATSLGNLRTQLGVPLLRGGEPIGVIVVARQQVEPFNERQIELVTTFADQAVIAIENARLLNELRDRTDDVMRREAELRVTFDNMADGVVMFDAEMRLAAWNRNFEQILHLPDAFLAERPSYADYFRYLAERGEFGAVDVDAELRRYEQNVGRQWSSERTRPDGRVIEVRNNPVPGGGLVLIYSDITERKEAEAKLRAARDAAEATLRELRAAQANLIHAEKMASLGQLTTGIAHEIKNPLNFVNNFAGLSVELLEELKETTAPAIARLAADERGDVDEIVAMLTGNLEKIAEHGRRADGIVKSMLEHSRGGSGERREVDLNGLVEEALNLAYHGARAQDQKFNITLERDFDRALAAIELAPQEMTRVFLNLFGNGFYAATKRQRDGAEPDFRPTLNVTTFDLGEAVEIRIRDNGTGIPPEIRDKLFQPFFTTKPTGEGTGLGLSISWDIVTQQHGGTIEVDSRVGEFTEFTIRLPQARQVTPKEAAA